MRLSRVAINNFRNFADFEIRLAESAAVIVGENNVGKSNLLYALRLVLDPSLPDSARELEDSDFWDGLDRPFGGHKIEVSVDITDFDDNDPVQSVLVDALISNQSSPLVGQLTCT